MPFRPMSASRDETWHACALTLIPAFLGMMEEVN